MNNNIHAAKSQNELISSFAEYVLSFYAKGEIYDIGATREEVLSATVEYMMQINESDWMEWGDGDSLDRGRVRDIILKNKGA